MEISCYGNESCEKASIFIFIKINNQINIKINFLQNNYYLNTIEDYQVYSYDLEFVIDINTLKNYKNLYQYYLISLLLTENIYKLFYSEYGDLLGYNNKWCISCKKIWSNYFTEIFEYNYGLNIYPLDNYIEIKDNNEEMIIFYEENIENIENKNYLSYLIEIEIENIEKELFSIEKNIYKRKNLLLFSSKLKKFLNYDTIKYVNILLSI
jgi:hypothetical protein